MANHLFLKENFSDKNKHQNKEKSFANMNSLYWRLRRSGGNKKIKTSINTGINFVPEQEAWVVERMGRYSKILKPVNNFKRLIKFSSFN